MQELLRIVRRTEEDFEVEALSIERFATLVEPPGLSPSCFVGFRNVGDIGLEGVPFTFVLLERPWTLERNLAYPVAFRKIVYLTLHGRAGDQFALSLPPEFWLNYIL